MKLPLFIHLLFDVQTYFKALKSSFVRTLFSLFTLYVLLAVVGGVLVFSQVKNQLFKGITSLPESFSASFSNQALEIKEAAFPLVFSLGAGELRFQEKEMHISFLDSIESTVQYSDIVPNTVSFVKTKQELLQDLSSVLLSFFFVSLPSFLVALFLARMFETALYGFIFYNVLQLFKMKMTFMKSWQLMLLVSMAAEIINFVYILVYRNASFPMFDTALIAVSILLIQVLRKQKQLMLNMIEQQTNKDNE